ncbi:hypothetical protein C7271_14255 [filamentous cyanobacterium CCP5]|nr:hypothetical protein C7271_14255 [filamentous cyanobacterium CCP5]
MWRDFQNLMQTLKHYRVMSPDRAIRGQVNELLKARPLLTVEEWRRRCWSPPTVSEPISPALTRFLYRQLGEYSGLRIGCTRPSDRLLEDLHFPLVCWFDWGLVLREDVNAAFGIDITDSFDERNYVTLADLVIYLDDQIKAHRPPSA